MKTEAITATHHYHFVHFVCSLSSCSMHPKFFGQHYSGEVGVWWKKHVPLFLFHLFILLFIWVFGTFAELPLFDAHHFKHFVSMCVMCKALYVITWQQARFNFEYVFMSIHSVSVIFDTVLQNN